MSQLGMQLPGSAARRGSSINVYAMLMLVAVLCLIASVAVVYLQGQKIAPDGKPWQVHASGQKIELKK